MTFLQFIPLHFKFLLQNRLLIFLPAFFIISTVPAQNDLLDSLKTRLKTAQDSLYMNLANEISLQYELSGTQTDSMLHYGQLLLEYAQKRNNIKGKCNGAYRIGRAYLFKGDYEQALFHYEKVRKWDPFGQYNQLFGAISDIGYIHQNFGAENVALQLYQKTLVLADSIENQEAKAKIFGQLGEIYRHLREPEKAIEYHEKAMALYKMLDNKYEQYRITERMALARDIAGDRRAALEDFKNCFATFGQLMGQQDSARTYDNIGRMYQRLEVFDSAKIYLFKGLEVSNRINWPFTKAHILNELMTVYKKEKNYQSALQYGKQAFEIAENINHYYLGNDITRHLYEIYAALGNFEKAYQIKLENDFFIDTIFSIEKVKSVSEMEAKYEAAKKEKELLEKESSIQLLKKKREVADLQRNLVIAGLLLFGMGGWYLFRKWRKRRRQEAEILERETEELKKLDALKSNFFANISHELRTPLTLILGPINAILSGKMGQITRQIDSTLELAKRNSQRLLVLIEEILDLSKLESNKLEVQLTEVPLKSFVKRITSSFESAAHIKGIDFKLNNLLPDGLIVETDKRKFEKILNNLISNALKFTPQTGEIIFIADTKENGNLQFRVKDSGRGIHPEDLPHIFNRFYQSRQTDIPLEGGTGIGLALSKEYAKLLGGDLKVESEYGKGSMFVFEMPKRAVDALSWQPPDPLKGELPPAATTVLAEDDSSSEASGSKSEPLPTTENLQLKTVLIVEDNRDMQEFLKGILSSEYQIETAWNGKVALEKLKKEENNIDLILSDVMMPEMDGFTLLNELKKDENLLGIPVIMLTARAGMRDKLQALNAGVDDYMTKPFSADELTVRVKNLLGNYAQRQNLKPETNKSKGIRKADLEWLQKMEGIVKREITNSNYTLLSLAHEVAVSKSQLFRKIKILTGITPNKYFREIKLNLAKEMLEDHLFSTMAEVSYAVGFDDPQYFSNIYDERFGKRPSAYF